MSVGLVSGATFDLCVLIVVGFPPAIRWVDVLSEFLDSETFRDPGCLG